MDGPFRRLVENIFNNWTALQLAVEHSMGGPNSKQTALDSIDYVVNYLVKEPDIEVEDIEDVLEDIMDQEFNTMCEDNSVKEIADLLYKFTQLLRDGEMDEYEKEYNNLPVGKQWLLQSQPAQSETRNAPAPSTSDLHPEADADSPMEEVDPEWTHVKPRRKRQ